MRYIIKGLVITFVGYEVFTKASINYIEIILLLLVVSATLLIYELGRKWQYLLMAVESVLVVYGCLVLGFSYELMGIILFDIIYLKFNILFILLEGALLLFREDIPLSHLMLVLGLICTAAYILRQNAERSLYYRSILDDERRMRYDLETVKNELVRSNEEIERLTQVKERNRIARDLHDTIGHSLAGVLIQLQAALKIFERDPLKTQSILEICIEKLQSALENVRNTVHNMYHFEKMGIDKIHEIITSYKFCKVDVTYTGDFSTVPNQYLETFTYILKEALTNTAKHSSASKMDINLSVNEKILRLEMYDNGNGFKTIKESLGIRGMKDRVISVKGLLSIDGSQGTRIVCTIPLFKEQKDEG